MGVNEGNRTSDISFSDLQTAYGDPTPNVGDTRIPLSSFYRGVGVVPTTAATGDNPYTGTTSFNIMGNGNGGDSGLAVTVENQDFQSVAVAANTGVSGAVIQTNPGTTSTSFGPLTRQEFSGNGIVNTADLSYVTARSQGRGNHTVVLYPGPNGQGHPTQIFSYSQDDNPGFNISYRGAAWQSGDPGGNGTQYGGNRSLGFSGFVSAGANTIGRRTVTTTTSPTTYNVRYTNNTDFTITGIVTNHGTFDLGPRATRDFNNQSSSNVSRTDHPAVFQNNPRRSFTFTNDTGQLITGSATGAGNTQTFANLARNGTVTTGTLTGSNEMWSANFSYADAGSGSGNADDTVADIDVVVETTPGMTVPGALSVQEVGTASQVGSWFRSGSGPERQGFERIDFDSTTSFARLQWGRTQGGNTWEVRQNNVVIASGTGNQELLYRGPAYQSGDSGLGRTAAQVAAAPELNATGQLTIAYRGNASSRGLRVGRGVRGPSTTTPTTHDITFTNNTGEDIIFSGSTTGNAAGVTASDGQVINAVTDGSSPDWSFQYRYAGGTRPVNTAIPDGTSGMEEITLGQFNTPGTFAP